MIAGQQRNHDPATPSSSTSDTRLARGWRASKVKAALCGQDTTGLREFLKRRFDERFFRPIRVLRRAPGNEQGYGFAIMAICSLLVETIECYRLGLPSTYAKDLNGLSKWNPPSQYDLPADERKTNGRDVFKAFFDDNKALFPGIDGGQFYCNIRNGLLHQAQTKGGWKIGMYRSDLSDPNRKIVDRDLFAQAVEDSFDAYLDDLRRHTWRDDIWQKAARKIWWLIRLSG